MKRLIFVVFLMVAGTAHAAPFDFFRPTAGYLYFNRPGADMAAHDAELKNCAEAWYGGFNSSPQRSAPFSESRGIVVDAIWASMAEGFERARQVLNLEHCMVTRGWRVVRLPDADGERLAQLPRPVLAAELAPWVGARQPPGEIARVWGNEAGRGDLKLTADSKDAERTLLSALAADLAAAAPARPMIAAGDTAYRLPGRATWIKPTKTLEPPAAGGLVIIRMRGEDRRNPSLHLEKVAAEYDPAHPWGDIFVASFKGGAKVSGVKESTQVFAVSPGKWRVWTASTNMDFCMGAPSFEIGAGEVVFLGTFNYGSQPVTPDMNLEPASGLLANHPDLRARLRPAEWVNGSTAPCRQWHPYALEFAGFPYEEGYDWAGRAPR